MTLADIFSDPFLTKIVIKALIVGTLVSLSASMLGASLVLKRYSMIGDGLSHVGFFSLAIATVLGLADYSMELSIPIVIVCAFLILRLRENSHIKGDAAIALLSTGAIAVGSLIYNFSGTRSTDICNSLFGSASIITLTEKELIMSICLSVAVILLFALFYNKIFAVTFDETFSSATGIRTDLYKSLIAILTAVTIVIGMQMMGSIMISALVIFPALTAMRVCRSFKGVVLFSTVLAVICFLIGFFVACRLSFQTGATVVTVHILVFLFFSAGAALTTHRMVRKQS